jgi:hypothetical protein
VRQARRRAPRPCSVRCAPCRDAGRDRSGARRDAGRAPRRAGRTRRSWWWWTTWRARLGWRWRPRWRNRRWRRRRGRWWRWWRGRRGSAGVCWIRDTDRAAERIPILAPEGVPHRAAERVRGPERLPDRATGSCGIEVKRAALSLVLAATIVACGGVTTGGLSDAGGSGSGSGGSSSGGGTSSGGGLSAACPATAPNGGTCTPVGLVCEYGSDPDVFCDVRTICASTGWSTNTVPATGTCPTSAPGANGCPSTYAGAVPGHTCSPDGLECGYSQGRCACTTQQSGPPHVLLDGGVPGAVWVCEQPGEGCPEPRPNFGSVCTTTGRTCDYGSCSLPGGTAAVCTNGVWTQTAIPCPL